MRIEVAVIGTPDLSDKSVLEMTEGQGVGKGKGKG